MVGGDGSRPRRVGFVMEQTLGHVSHSQTLAWGAKRDPQIESRQADIEFGAGGLPWSLPLVRHNWSLRGSLKARNALAHLSREPLDALFIHTLTITLFAGRYLDRVPTVLSLDATPENYDHVGSWYGHRVQPRALELLKRTLRSRVLRKAAAVVTWCDWARRSLIDDYGLDGDRIHVIGPGADVKRFPFGAQARRNGHERPVRLLFVGGDFDRKGGRILMQAYRAGLRDRAELHLVTQEDVPEERGVFVHRGLTSNSPELISLYESADVFVLPTLGDCFPVVMGEAMAAGLPIVTTDVGALREAVQAGTNGFVVPAGDDVALVSALDVLVRNPELRVGMGLTGRRIAEDRFDSHRNAAKVMDLLKNVCSNGRDLATDYEPEAVSA